MIAKARAVAGEAYAHNTRGELRILDTGDLLYEGETVVTPDGGRVELELADGSTVDVQELSGRKLGRDLLSVTRIDSFGGAAGAARIRAGDYPRICDIVDGGVVQSARGQNLFFNEKPLYWALDARGDAAQAIAHINREGEFTEQVAFSLRLDGGARCQVQVAEGEFSEETHSIPFTTGDPEPGAPVSFFGISDGAVVSEGDVPPGAMSAEVHSIGVSNNWYREGEDIVFEFLARPGERRSINNFAFKNSGSSPVAFVARAYRGAGSDPVYEAGSEQAPLRMTPDAVFSVISQLNYDRLVLTPVGGCDSCRRLSLSLEGFSEFRSMPAEMRFRASGIDFDGTVCGGQFVFCIDAGSGDVPEVHFEPDAGAASGGYNSVWEQLC